MVAKSGWASTPAAYRRDRDTRALEQAMAHLDAEEAVARATSKVVSAAEAVAWLRDLPALWTAADDSGRRLLTEAIFEKVEVLGVQSDSIHPTSEADAHGWSDAFGTLPLRQNAGRAFSTDGRGERDSPATNVLPITMRLAEPLEPCEYGRDEHRLPADISAALW